MAAPEPGHETRYERNQRFNALTAWLHTFRYRNLLRLVAGLAREIPDRPLRILEIGAAHGRLYEVLDERFRIEYAGVELSPEFVERALARHGDRSNFRMRLGSAADPAVYEGLDPPDLVCALETLEHIPERESFRIVEHLAPLRPRLFICSVPVEIGPSILIKNVGSLLIGYNRHRSYPWRDTFWASLYRFDHLPPHATGHRGFDWRWLAQTIRHFFRIREIRKNPFQWVPVCCALSVMFVAEPREDARPRA